MTKRTATSFFYNPPSGDARRPQAEAHQRAARDFSRGSKHERAMRDLVRGFLTYADAHREMWGDEPADALYACRAIGRDGLLGPAWAKIGEGLLELFEGDTGRFDPETLKHIIRHALNDAGLSR